MEVLEKSLSELQPYKNNPRHNDIAVEAVMKSIKEFGFRVSVIIDSGNNIICGHTRYEAAAKLGLNKVPCIMASDLTEKHVKAFRLADNKVGEMAKHRRT